MSDEKNSLIEKVTKTVAQIAVALLAILGSLFALNWYIDDRVEKKLKEQEVINEIAKHIKPYLIFDF